MIDAVTTRLKRWARAATGGGRVWPELLLIAVVVIAVRWYQTRDLLPADAAAAPPFRLQALSGEFVDLADLRGRPTLVYFFAPWCTVCKTSIDNLDDLVDSGAVAWGTAVALDYESAAEVSEFVEETGISLPVLMGDGRTAADWSIRGYPTYYVIDAEGRIHSRSVGYSTKLGMRWRAWRAR